MAGKHALKTPKEPRFDPTTVRRVLKHPAAAPAAVTVVGIALVMGLGWLNQTNEVGPGSLATPLAEGGSITSAGGPDGGVDDREVGDPDIGDAVLATRGRRAVLVPTWMDLPLVTPALAVRPDAIETLIPGAEPTTMPPPGSGSGSGSSSGSGSGTGGSGTTGTTRPRGGTSTPGSGGTTGTTGPGSTPTTAPPDTTPTTAPPDTTPTTDPPDTTPTTDPPDTTPTTDPPDTTPTTDPPDTTPTTEETVPPASQAPGGLLDVVDDLLDTIAPVLEPLPLL